MTDPDPCVSCVEITESRSMDVLEIDAASNTGIDDVRETYHRRHQHYIRHATGYKIFIIDEVHQLSKPALTPC